MHLTGKVSLISEWELFQLLLALVLILFIKTGVEVFKFSLDYAYNRKH